MEDWRKRIEKSASDVQIPESLEPERMEERLRQQPKRKTAGSRKILQWGGIAAAAAVCLMAGPAVWKQMHVVKEETVVQNPAAETVQEAGADYTEYEGIDAFYHIISEKDLKKQLKKAWKENQKAVLEDYAATAESTMDMTPDVNGSAVTEDAVKTSAAAADGSAEHSETNLQVDGVDEGDVVKTDGKYIYVLSSDGKVRIVNPGKMKLVTEFTPYADRAEVSWEEMYVDGTHMILVGTVYESQLQDEADTYYMSSRVRTILLQYDLQTIDRPKQVGKVLQDGYYNTSRKIGSRVYLFSNYSCNPEDIKDTDALLPSVNGQKLSADSIYVPDEINSTEYILMTAADVSDGVKVTDRKSLLQNNWWTDFHVTEDSIYFLENDSVDVGRGRWQEYTNVIRFAMKSGKFQAVGAASLKGSLTDTFAVNEKDGYLRILLTDRSGSVENNRIYVLNQNMRVKGQVENLARGEVIYSARFLGNMGYFVTYRNTDPLFTVDFSDPEHPEITGELSVTGFSEYLHFYGKDQLLGLGYETDPDSGEQIGLKLSMFDVSKAEAVEENRLVLESDDVYSPALYDYKQVLVDPKKNLIGFALRTYKEDEETFEYLIYGYEEEKGFEEKARIRLGNFTDTAYWYDDQVRGLYVGNRLYVLETGGITAYDLKEFREVGSLKLDS